MRFMLVVRADSNSEAGEALDQKLLAAMERFNEEMGQAGVLLATAGLQASARVARLTFTDGAPALGDEAREEAKTVIAGFWLVEVGSREEAIEWAMRAPLGSGEIEICEVLDLGERSPGAAVRHDARIRDQLAEWRGTLQ